MPKYGGAAIPMQFQDKINYIVGDLNSINLVYADSPFNTNAIEFLNEVSKDLIKSCPKSLADVISFAFFCRRSNLLTQQKLYASNRLRLGRGKIFHITPSNVPVNFAFSFAFSLLSGNNCNIVRLSTKEFEQSNIICNSIKGVLERNPQFSQIKNGTIIIRYPQNNDITAELSLLCDVRVIWGGDKTIANIRSLPIKASAIEIPFFDRLSFCVIDSDSVIKADDNELNNLAKAFYNDTYLNDQNACSSPQVVFWKKSNDIQKSKAKFWKALEYYLLQNNYELQPVSHVNKLNLAYSNVIMHENCNINNEQPLIYRAQLNDLEIDLENEKGNCGYFYEYDINNLSEILPLTNRRIQTLTYYGIKQDELNSFIISHKPQGLDRIVPMGKALDIGLTWDGFNLIETFSRIINIS